MILSLRFLLFARSYVFGSVGEFSDLEDGGGKGANLSNLFKCAVQVDAAGSAFEQMADVSEKFLPHLFKNEVVYEKGAGEGGVMPALK